MPFLTRWHINWSGGGIAGSAASTLHYELTGDTLNEGVITPIALTLQGVISDNLRKVVPGAVTLAVAPEVQVIEPSSGQITNVLVPTNGTAPMGGQGTGPYSVASGAVVTLNTPGIVNGRRVKGRLFAVPLSGDAYDNDGTLSAGGRNFLQAFGSGLLGAAGSAGALVVYSRPTAPGGRVGAFHAVTSAVVRDRVAILRSRRD